MTLAVFENTYSSKSVAQRGAKRAGLEVGTYSVEFDHATDKWMVIDKRPQEDVRTEADPKPVEEIVPMHSAEDMAKMASTLPAPVKRTREEIDAARAERRARIDAQKAADKANRAPMYKELMKVAPDKSQIDKPVAFVHNYLETHFGTKTRKLIIADLVAYGLNINMCRSQYQIFKAKREAAQAAAIVADLAKTED